MLTSVPLLFRKTKTRHRYNTRANQQKIVFEYEQENVVTREALTQLQGQMGTILEHLQAQRDNGGGVNLTDAIVADIALVVVDPIDSVVQPVDVSQSLFPAGPSRFPDAYPWRMPHNYTP